MVIFLENREDMKKYQDLIRQSEDYNNSDEQRKRYLEEANDLKEKIDIHLASKIPKVEAIVEQRCKKVMTVKELKKALNKKYKEIREEYTSLQEALKKNVELKKSMRETIAHVDSVLKDENLKMTQEDIDSIYAKFINVECTCEENEECSDCPVEE